MALVLEKNSARKTKRYKTIIKMKEEGGFKEEIPRVVFKKKKIRRHNIQEVIVFKNAIRY